MKIQFYLFILFLIFFNTSNTASSNPLHSPANDNHLSVKESDEKLFNELNLNFFNKDEVEKRLEKSKK